jgi:hypothetical protein
MNEQNVEAFFRYARERETIRIHREEQGWPKPWSDDPVLQEYRFCNVFREDDKVTRHFREHYREPLRNSADVLLATIIYRWFNRPETIDRLRKADAFLVDSTLGVNHHLEWDAQAARRALTGVNPIVTAAYIVKTPNGKNKLEGILWCIEQVSLHCGMLAQMILHERSLQKTCQALQEYPFLGPFMAYEIVTDLRHTRLLETATDITTWANPGPGAARGLGRVLHDRADHFNANSVRDAHALQEGMRMLLSESQDGRNWPISWPRWEMREVEHTLCEFDKYERARLGEGKPKQRYGGK